MIYSFWLLEEQTVSEEDRKPDAKDRPQSGPIAMLMNEQWEHRHIQPADPTIGWSAAELKAHLACGEIRVVNTRSGNVMVIDRSGPLGDRPVNESATNLLKASTARNTLEYVTGPVIITDPRWMMNPR